MMDPAEIKTVMRSLEKTQDAETIKTLLDKLDKEIEPTEKLLRETKLGIAVNKFRTHDDTEVSSKVKKIIKKWKDEVSLQKAKQKEAKRAKSEDGEPKAQATAAKFTSDGKPRDAKNDGVKTDIYDDRTRNAVVALLYKALANESDAAPAEVLNSAKSVEQVVFEGEKGVTQRYRDKTRSLNLNLNKNPKLRANVVSSAISADRLYKMSPQEMASDELKKEMEKLNEQNLFNAQSAVEKRAITTRFTCGKCKQKRVSYYQMQTRSADEPMTTFCTCENCGNRWKFS